MWYLVSWKLLISTINYPKLVCCSSQWWELEFLSSLDLFSVARQPSWFCSFLLLLDRAIFVWPWNENAGTKQKQETNGNRAIWLVYRTDQSILRFDVIPQHDWPIETMPSHIRVFFGGKTKRPCFDLFIHWLIKQITNAYQNHFSRSYENHSY